jgi:hypothetical protein
MKSVSVDHSLFDALQRKIPVGSTARSSAINPLVIP